MKMLHDFKVLGIAYASGIALACFLPETCFPPVAALSFAGAASCTILAARRDNHIPPVLLAFLLAGICAYASYTMGHFPDSGTVPRGSAVQDLCSLIDRCGFKGDEVPGLAKALLCGDRSFLSHGTKENFSLAGASHILALSGLHLGIIITLTKRLLFWTGNGPVGFRLRSLLGTAAAGYYCISTGASPSVTRAFLFIGLNELARQFPERERRPLNIYFCALMIQLSFNPGIIRSAGFQLSYLAMLGIYLLFPVLESWLPEEGCPRLARTIWRSAALSISCQAFTAPAVWLHFRTFPDKFLITNLLALPLCELFICSCVSCLVLETAGLCPEIAKSLASMAGQALIFCIDTVSTL